MTYIKEYTIALDSTTQEFIAQAIYQAFYRELSDYLDDGDPDNIPSDTLKEIFSRITENMIEDEEFWGG